MTQYARGATFERQVMKDLARFGWEVFRSAGSHGKADVVAIRPGRILLIQCKISGEIDRAEWNEVVRMAERLQPNPGSRRVVLPMMAVRINIRLVEYRELLRELEHGERRALAFRSWNPEEDR